MIIGNRDAGGTQRSFPVPPCPSREVTSLIFRGVVSTAAPLALPRSPRAEADLSILGIPWRIVGSRTEI